MTRAQLPGAALPPRSAVVTVGTFDGVHRGHQAVLHTLVAVARERRQQSVILTFDPHPLHVIRPETAPRLLTTTEERSALLRAAGADRVSVLPFTRELSSYPPRRFVEDVLLEHFGLDHLVIGYDHGFGKDRTGDVGTLQSIGAELGFGVTVVPHTDLHDAPISSTRIRRLLQEGDVVEAAEALGRPYSIAGNVVRGDGRGRSLGFPTANLDIGAPEKLLPADGIYAVVVQMGDTAGSLEGVLHLGERPTFAGASSTIEVMLFEFDGDLYGERLRVEFHGRVRGIERFDNVDELVSAMNGDVLAARNILAHERVLSRDDRAR
jgi:riboflavin kinase / FMN adenylyltransferase